MLEQALRKNELKSLFLIWVIIESVHARNDTGTAQRTGKPRDCLIELRKVNVFACDDDVPALFLSDDFKVKVVTEAVNIEARVNLKQERNTGW